jgi:hypothetical protein
MRRLIASSTILAVAAAGTIALGQAGSAAPSGTTAKPESTHFALKTSGYGTRLKGGQIPAGSDTTAYRVIGCTNKAGLDRENHQAEETLPGVGTASQVKTRVWTTTNKNQEVVSSWSRNTIKRVTMEDNPLGTVEINGIRSVSRAYHDDSGFHAETTTDIGSITLTPAGGEPQVQELPAPGEPLEIPGVATITVGKSIKKTSASGASASADVLDIVATMSGSRARIAHTQAEISGGIKSGVFGGFASGTRAKGLEDNVSSGYTPLLVMPCQGTRGEVRTKAIASSDLGGQVVVSGISTKEMAKQNGSGAEGYEQARIAGLDLGGGQLVIEGIIGRANVERVGNHVKSNSKGTSIGTITANGEPQAFPDTDVLEIPGVARLERNIVKKFKSGIYVTGLRITLLDGSGGVINLAEARLRIRPSGN